MNDKEILNTFRNLEVGNRFGSPQDRAMEKIRVEQANFRAKFKADLKKSKELDLKIVKVISK